MVLEKAKCPKCKVKLKIIELEREKTYIGDCENPDCKSSWYFEKDEEEGGFFARPAKKGKLPKSARESNNSYPKKAEWGLTDFKLFKINFFRGADKKINGFIKKVFVKPIIDITEYSDEEIKFNFALQMKPDIGEIWFDGKCTIYSSDKERFSKLIKYNFDDMKQTIKKDILRESYPHSKRFAKTKGINLPPLDFIMKNIGEL